MITLIETCHDHSPKLTGFVICVIVPNLLSAVILWALASWTT